MMMIPLINPTDNQLNAAFAEKVGGWTIIATYADSHLGHYAGLRDSPTLIPSYITSVDAVMPYLSKRQVSIHSYPAKSWSISVDGYLWHCTSFAKAAVIAMLRAHGIEVMYQS